MISIALYKPDIPQNTASIIRLCACFRMKLHIIEPCAFSLEDARFKRVVMDYMALTTKAKKFYHKFIFKKNDILLFGRESAGVPKTIHDRLVCKLKIPMSKKTRSLNVAMSVAISSSEALKQNK